MKKYITKRLLISFLTLFCIILVLFLMLQFMPGSPFNDEKLTADQLVLLNAKYGLDKPIYVQFYNYFTRMIRGDLGVSYAINKNFPVTEMILPRLAVTCRIGLQAMVLGTLIGLTLGIVAAIKHNSWVDTILSVISVIGVSVPNYVFALGLAYFIGYKLGWFPILYRTQEPMYSSILPTIALSMFPIAQVARFTRSEMIEVLQSDYILLAQAKGVKDLPLLIRHALRNALIPIITVIGPLLVNLLTGSLVIEKVFAIPGLGYLMVNAIQYNDYNVVIGCAFVYSTLYIVTMLLVDVLYGVIDPRIRLAKEAK